MAYVAKLNPSDFDIASLSIQLPPKSRTIEIGRAEKVFIWTAETAGGKGLIGRGIASGMSKEDATLMFSSLMLLSGPLFEKAQLQPHREAGEDTLIGFLARKLYFYAHLRIVRIPDRLAEELHREFLDHFAL